MGLESFMSPGGNQSLQAEGGDATSGGSSGGFTIGGTTVNTGGDINPLYVIGGLAVIGIVGLAFVFKR